MADPALRLFRLAGYWMASSLSLLAMTVLGLLLVMTFVTSVSEPLTSAHSPADPWPAARRTRMRPPLRAAFPEVRAARIVSIRGCRLVCAFPHRQDLRSPARAVAANPLKGRSHTIWAWLSSWTSTRTAYRGRHRPIAAHRRRSADGGRNPKARQDLIGGASGLKDPDRPQARLRRAAAPSAPGSGRASYG